MVLESLISGVEAEKRPKLLISIGIIITVAGIIFAQNVFPLYSSIVFLFFAVMASLPIMIQIIRLEEKKDLGDFHEYALLKEHSKAIKAFMALFLGMVLGVVVWYVYPAAGVGVALLLSAFMLESSFKNKLIFWIVAVCIVVLVASFWRTQPVDEVNNVFSSQISTLNQINGPTGAAIGITTHATTVIKKTPFNQFTTIFFNNVKVLIYAILFSFLYGAGAIFILTWNASVIGVAIGNYLRAHFAEVASWLGFSQVAGYLHVTTCGLLRYVIHGIPEIGAYFVGALAGGIISVAVIKHDFKGKKFEHIVLDSSDLFLLSVAILLVTAVLEVWVSPFLFNGLCIIG